MRLSARDRKTLSVGLVLAAVIVLWVFVADPGIRRWQALNDEIAKKESELAKYERAGTLAQQAERLRERVGRAVTSYSRPEGYREQTPRLISQLEGFAAYKALNVTRWEPVAIRSNPEAQYAQCSLALSFDCTTKELAEFLYELRRAEPALLVESLKVSQAPGAGGRLSVNMVVASFAMVEEEGAG